MNDELKDKYMPPYFYKFRPSFIQPHKSNTILLSPVKFTPSNQTMEFQPILDDIMAKIDNLLQIINSFNQNSKSSVSYAIPTIEKSKKSLITIKIRILKKIFFKISSITVLQMLS